MGQGVQKTPKGSRVKDEASLLRFTVKRLEFLETLGQLTFMRNQTVGIRYGGKWFSNPNKGSPDLLIWFRGGAAIGLELKDPKGYLSLSQLKFKDRWKRIGVPYHVEDSEQGVVKLLRTYGVTHG